MAKISFSASPISATSEMTSSHFPLNFPMVMGSNDFSVTILGSPAPEPSAVTGPLAGILGLGALGLRAHGVS